MKNNIMAKKIFWILAVVMVVFSSSAIAQPRLLKDAEKAYGEGRYADAAAIYESIAKEQGVSAELYANMGNAYAKAGDYGHAFLCYERSLYLDPSDKQVRNNRAYILSKIEDGNKANAKGKKISVTTDEPSFFLRLKHYITHSHTSDTWAQWGAAMFVLLCVCIALYIFRQEIWIRKTGFFGAIAFFALCIVFMSFSFASASACKAHNQGVITGFKVTLLAEPFTSSKATGTPLERGTKLDILETETDQNGAPLWYKVRLNSEFAGWVPAGEFEVI